jgi:hypothetical protein
MYSPANPAPTMRTSIRSPSAASVLASIDEFPDLSLARYAALGRLARMPPHRWQLCGANAHPAVRCLRPIHDADPSRPSLPGTPSHPRGDHP